MGSAPPPSPTPGAMLSSEAEGANSPVYLWRTLADVVAEGVCECQHANNHHYVHKVGWWK